ncbi:hypothetical protein [Mesorhizobium sp.]|uniref:hypothetical protein n=1 Tax=Mesorhizobium sp. TaxID=1871066 RepID=UPI0025F9DC56|nr:hypothetical protein [Mesorhizobium sp.]
MKQKVRKSDGGDYVAAEDWLSMFEDLKYNSMNSFTFQSICQQNKEAADLAARPPSNLSLCSGTGRQPSALA